MGPTRSMALLGGKGKQRHLLAIAGLLVAAAWCATCCWRDAHKAAQHDVAPLGAQDASKGVALAETELSQEERSALLQPKSPPLAPQVRIGARPDDETYINEDTNDDDDDAWLRGEKPWNGGSRSGEQLAYELAYDS